ncbi:MAG: HD domain-containing protein [Patescibacteria group bacterium]
MENRESFFARLRAPAAAALFSDDDVARIEMAYDLSKYAHRAQERKDGERYFEHPRRVAISLLDRLEIFDLASVVAALLHDAYEDAPQYMTPMKVRILGGADADRMVRLLSKVPEKNGYVERLRRHGDWKTIGIKLCDRDDNMSSLDAGSEEFQRKQTIETRDVYLPLFLHLVTITPSSHLEPVAAMVRSLHDTVERWTKTFGIDPPRCPPE